MTTTTTNASVQNVAIASVHVPAWNNRTSDKELAESVRLHGVLSPICVVPAAQGDFQLVYGSRRLDAARKAGLAEIPSIVRQDLPEVEQRIIALVENVQRAGGDPLQEGRIFKELVALGLGVGEVSKRVSKHANYVRLRIRLASLDDSVLRALDGTDYDPRAAAMLSLLDPADACQLAESMPHLATDPDMLRDHLVRTAPKLADSPFDTADAALTGATSCTACPKQLDGRCLDSACYLAKASTAVERALAKISADSDTPVVLSAEPADDILDIIARRYHASVLRRERIAGDDESGGRHAICLDGLRPRLVRLVPSNRPKDGRALRHNDQRRQAQVRASFIARAAGELLAKRLDAPSEPDPIDAARFLAALAAAASGETIADLAHAQRVLLRLLLFRVRRNLYLGESISGIDPGTLRETSRAVLACLDPDPDATLAHLDEQAETALKA